MKIFFVKSMDQARDIIQGMFFGLFIGAVFWSIFSIGALFAIQNYTAEKTVYRCPDLAYCFVSQKEFKEFNDDNFMLEYQFDIDPSFSQTPESLRGEL